MDEQRLQEIEERAGKASDAPWEWNKMQEEQSDGEILDLGLYIWSGPVIAERGEMGSILGYDRNTVTEPDDPDFCDEDLDFICHARQDVPALLAEVRRLQTENARLRAVTQDALHAAETTHGLWATDKPGAVQDNTWFPIDNRALIARLDATLAADAQPEAEQDDAYLNGYMQGANDTRAQLRKHMGLDASEGEDDAKVS